MTETLRAYKRALLLITLYFILTSLSSFHVFSTEACPAFYILSLRRFRIQLDIFIRSKTGENLARLRKASIVKTRRMCLRWPSKH